MSKVIIGIGVPGSGKTTALKRYAEDNKIVRISYDEIFERHKSLTTERVDFGDVIDEGMEKLQQCIKDNVDVIIDATSAKKADRISTIEKIKSFDSNAEIVALYFKIDSHDAGLRNHRRGLSGERFVPGSVINKMDNLLNNEPPNKNEGFNEIFEIDANKKPEEIDNELSKLLSN